MNDVEKILPKYITIYKDLREWIESATFKHGEKIGTEEQLCKKYNVSRITIKKALDMLENDGIIYRMKGKGIFYRNLGQEIPGNKKDENSRGSPRLIGYIHESENASYGSTLLKSLIYNASAMNYNVIVKYTFGDIEAENRAIDELMEADVKGLIINPVHGEYYNPKILKLVLDGFPVVLVDKFFKGINVPVISIDHKKAMKDLTRYLISCNHTNIAIISTKSQNTSSIEERILGFIEELAYYKIKFDEANILQDIPLMSENVTTFVYDDKLIETALKIISDFIKNQSKVTAFICINYLLALLTYLALQKLGIKVPNEKSIVCFDGVDSKLYPTIKNFTCIRQDEIAIGEIAVETIDKLIRGEEIAEKRLYVGYKLIDYGTVKKL